MDIDSLFSAQTVVKAIRQTGSTGYGELGLRCGSEVSANLHTFNA